MIKFKTRLLLVGTALLLFCFPCFGGVPVNGWYCMRAGKCVPPIPEEFLYLEELGGYYVDRSASDENRVIYLTFDAGYENGNIAKILDVMKRHDAKGGFFILENLIDREPELVKRMVDEGHIVANHTASHRDMTSVVSKEDFAAELCSLESSFKQLCGTDMKKYYRPPEGKLSRQSIGFAHELGYKTIMWSFAYADWDNDRQPDPDQAFKKIIDNTHNGMIILLHPTSSTNAEILDRLLVEWSNAGYRFGTLDELP